MLAKHHRPSSSSSDVNKKLMGIFIPEDPLDCEDFVAILVDMGEIVLIFVSNLKVGIKLADLYFTGIAVRENEYCDLLGRILVGITLVVFTVLRLVIFLVCSLNVTGLLKLC